jgi:outer membrane protein assembly factor BamE (lipoprotein component of BamABCDE complex)
MKLLQQILIPLACLTLMGCATRTDIAGSEFDTSKISEIKKGVTTSDELVSLLGTPGEKSVKTEDEVIWKYEWIKSTSRTTMGWTGPNVVIDGYQKSLQVLIKNGVVVNYTFNEGPFHKVSREGSK